MFEIGFRDHFDDYFSPFFFCTTEGLFVQVELKIKENPLSRKGRFEKCATRVLKVW